MEMVEKPIPGCETILVMGLFVESPHQFQRVVKDLIPSQYSLRIYSIYNVADWQRAGKPKMYYSSNVLDQETFTTFVTEAAYLAGEDYHDFKKAMSQYRDAEDPAKRVRELRNYKAKKIFAGIGT